MIRLFDIEQENNIPSFFSAALLLLASLLLAVIAVMKRKSPAPYTLQWAILAFTFLYLAVDEAASIHELLMRPARELLGDRASGILYFPWVIPGMAATLAFALSFLPFVLHLPLHTRLLVLLAASLFVGGAIGMELIGGRYADLYGRDFKYNMIATLEEGLEMAGAIAFIYAMLAYIGRYYGQVRFRLM